MLLQLDAPYYLEANKEWIPTGNILPVENSDFDFQTLRFMDKELNHCFVFSPYDKKRPIGCLYSPNSHILMTVETDLPAAQIYTCNDFQDDCGKGGIPLHRYQGVAFETQRYPDSPNHPNFPSCVLKAGEHWTGTTSFHFFRRDK